MKNIFNLSNKVYDILKDITLIVLPALSVLIFACFELWGLDMVLCARITGTITAVITFLGSILKISSEEYNK